MQPIRLITTYVLLCGMLMGSSGCISPGLLSQRSELQPQPLETAATSAITPAGGSITEPHEQYNCMLPLSEVRPGQLVRLVTYEYLPSLEPPGHVCPPATCLEMLMVLDNMMGTVVSEDSSQIVLRDVVISSKRVAEEASGGALLTGVGRMFFGQMMEDRLIAVPGQVVIPREEIRGVQQISAQEMERVKADLADTTPRYVHMDWSVNDPQYNSLSDRLVSIWYFCTSHSP